MFKLGALALLSLLSISIPLYKPEFRPPPGLEIPDLFPLEQDFIVTLKSTVGERVHVVQVVIRVNPDGEGYLYHYTVTNKSDYYLMFRMAILDQASGAEVLIIPLDAGQTREVEFPSARAPVFAESDYTVYTKIKPSDALWKEDIEKAKSKLDFEFFYPYFGKMPGALPAP